jgi:hypothetical protein
VALKFPCEAPQTASQVEFAPITNSSFISSVFSNTEFPRCGTLVSSACLITITLKLLSYLQGTDFGIFYAVVLST